MKDDKIHARIMILTHADGVKKYVPQVWKGKRCNSGDGRVYESISAEPCWAYDEALVLLHDYRNHTNIVSETYDYIQF